MGLKDPFEEFREKKAVEKLKAKAKGDSGPIAKPGKKTTEERPAFDATKNWIY
jgi:hypothetical protein